MDEPRREIIRREPRRRRRRIFKQKHRIGAIILARGLVEQSLQRIAHQRRNSGGILLERQALEAADPHMPVAQPSQHRRSRWRWLVIASQFFAGLDQCETFRCVDPKRLKHFGCQHLAYATLQGQPSIAEPAVRSRPRSLGAKVEQAALIVAELREQEAAPVANVGIIRPELVPVITQRQRRRQIVGEWLEPSEMPRPAGFIQVQPDPRRPPPIGTA